MNKLYLADSLDCLAEIANNSIDLVYIDPPFNTGKKQVKKVISVTADPSGQRRGFGGKKYATENISQLSYADNRPDYLIWLGDRLIAAWEKLKITGNMFVHLDYHNVHYVKVMMDEIFGLENYVESIYWTWDYGARTQKKFPQKVNEILWYVKDAEQYYFNIAECDRLPYMSPALVGLYKAEFGKYPTNAWWLTIVPTNSKEKTGWPNQKPLKLIERLVKTASPQGGMVLDFFAGSGTTGIAAQQTGRNYIVCDNNPEAVKIMKERLTDYQLIELDNAIQSVV
jgi:site-specific DNA-methyltransferase (adenine-specific)